MGEPTPDPILADKSTANLRITFWGVQGTCPIFPTQAEVAEYAQHLAVSTIEKLLVDVANRVERGEWTPAMLREMAKPQKSADYLQHLALNSLPVYGGDTTCVEVLTADGDVLLFDMGTGMRDFSRHAAAEWEGRNGRTIHVFASHEHLDHRNGLPFSGVCFDRKDPFTLNVHGTHQFLTALDDRYGIYSHQLTDAMHVDDPLDYRMIAAKFTATEIRTTRTPGDPHLSFDAVTRHVGQPIAIGNTTVTPFEVYHGNIECLGYKVRHGDSTFVFCTDHEMRHGNDPFDIRQTRSIEAERRLLEYCQDVDVAYFDGQYFLAEYLGQEGIGTGPGVGRMDWGHSCIEDVIGRVTRCGVRRAFIGHHDPERLWGDRIELDRHLKELSRDKPYHIELAKSGDVVEV